MEPIQDIVTEDFSFRFDPDSGTLFSRGFLRLEGVTEYQPLMDMMLKAVEACPTLVLNLEELEFLNSSGISMLSMFVVKIREREGVQFTLRGSAKILWQTKSLRNLQRLMPALKLELV
jgi:anti-anti-sigma factor